MHSSFNHILGPYNWNNCYLCCFQADVLVLTFLSDYWRVSGFDTGILVCSLIMLQIISMAQHENTDYFFLFGVCFLSVISSAGLSASCLTPLPSLRTSAFVFLAAFHSQTLHFMSPNKEVIAVTQFIGSALRIIEKFLNRKLVVKQRRTWYSYQHCVRPPMHIKQDSGGRHDHFHLKHTVQ